MADLVVGLAKSVVEGVLTNSQAAIEEEAKLRQSAQRDLVFIRGEFQMMQSFLQVANAERVENPVVITWVRQIRELAYDVEDCIEFVVHLDKKTSWWWRMVPGWMSWCVPVALPLDEAVDEIEQLKARVTDVSTRNVRYSLISDTGSKPVVAQQQPAPATAALSVLIGTGTRPQQGNLTDLLANDNIRVISVWGTGGDLGVTSIIWRSYNDKKIRQKFSCRAWVKLMQPFNPHEFVRCMTDQFYANGREQKEGEIIGVEVLTREIHGEQYHLNQFVDQINKGKSLVVLEGLSNMTDWDTISKFFPDRKNGSCIIVSTKQSEVATLSVGDPYKVLDLNQFSVDQSVYAFYKEGSQCEGDKGEKTGDKKEEAEDWTNNHVLVGRESEMNDLRQYTKKARFYSFEIISVWGIPGVGKSALLKNLYYERILEDLKLLEKEKPSIFDKYAWVDVSYPFNLRDFFQSLLLNFHSQPLQANKDNDIETMGSKNPIPECREILEKHKCLVVIDGLQSTKEWDLISQAKVVSGYSRNCIIVITTESSIAKHCRGKKGDLVFNVKGLEADTAFDLFKNEVSRKYPSSPILADGNNDAELRELISKCGGLPNVIVEIAGLLGRKAAARSINDKFIHDLENNRELDNLQGLFGWMRTFFRTCPDFLKPCIFYISIFPGDCPIQKRRLIRRWIAEGYSRDSHEESAEENGEKQFSGLLNLSIIQRTSQKIKSDTRMISVNGFIREYIVSKPMEENLCFELGASSTMTTQRTGRHLVILDKWKRDRIMFQSMDFSRLRSLTVFGDWKSYFISESMTLLRVLDLENASALKDDDVKKIVKVLLRLKFLSLRGQREIKHLPCSLHHLRQLQTLDVRGTSITTLPEKITKLQKLQYIRAGTMDFQPPVSSTRCSWLPEFCKCNRPTVGVEVPIGIGKVTALHTLGVVDVAASGATTILEELKKLTQLRKLGVSGINGKNIGKVFSAIEGHVHLESLSVRIHKENQGSCFKKDNNNQGYLDDMKSMPCKKLRSLKLYGLEDKLPNWGPGRLRNLAKLELDMACLTIDGMNFLGELPQLCTLRVKQLQDGQFHFNVSYRNVKVLEIACSSSKLSVTFGSKRMAKLELLKVDCPGAWSFQFSGMNNLEKLNEVLLVNGPNAETQKRHLESQLEGHPNKDRPSAPKLKLEEPPQFVLKGH